MSREGAKAGYIGEKGGSETVGTAAVAMHQNVKKWAPQDEKLNFRSAALERIGHGTDGGAKSGCDLSDILTGFSLFCFSLECRELIDEASVGLEPRSAPDEVDGALHVQDDCCLLVGRSHCAVLDGLHTLPDVEGDPAGVMMAHSNEVSCYRGCGVGVLRRLPDLNFCLACS